MGARIVNRIVDAYFTTTSLIVHALAYPALMAGEGGDFHLFLDGISIEAVFIALLVGISTKRNREGHRALTHLVERLHKQKESRMAIDPTVGQPVIGTPAPIAEPVPTPDSTPQMQVPLPISAPMIMPSSPLEEIVGLVDAAVSDPTSRNIAAVVTWAGGTAVSFGLVSDSTEQTVASAILGVLAVVFMVVNAIHGQHRAKVTEAAVYAAKS